MKKVLLSAGMLVALTATAQNDHRGRMGINTESPRATLDVTPNAANIAATATTNEGILAPRLTKARIANIATPVEGTLVYATDATYTGSNTKVAKITEKGYYFYNGTEWVKTSGTSGTVLPNGTQANQVLKWNGTAWIVGADADTRYTAGNGLSLSGTTFSANPAAIALGGDVTGNANANTVAKIQGRAVSNTAPTNGQVLKWNQAENIWKPENDANTNTTYTGSTSVVLSGTSFQRAALSGDVTSAQNNNTVTINNGAVTGAKIANGTITADKLAAGVIPTVPAEVDGIVGNEVTNATTARGLVRAGEGTNASPYTLGVADNGITNAMIANNAINSAKIQDGAITGADIANGTITANKLAAGVIPTVPAEVDGIVGNEVTNATTARGLVRAGEGTNASPYTLGVADNGITNAMIANNAINSAKIQDGAITGADIANGTITANKLAAGVIPTVPAEVDGIVGNEVTNATTARGLVRAGEGTNASPYTLGVADNGITNAMIANNAINSAKIQDGAITGADIANGTITANKLAAGVIPTDTNTNIYSNDGTLGGNRTIAMGDNNLMFTGTGKVGFGTATPRAKMDIVGGLRASKGDATEDASNVGYAFDGDGDTGLFATGGAATNGSDLILKNDNVTALTVKAGTRNIGIGTTNPSAKLDVAGGGRFKGTVDHILRIQRDGQTDFTDFVKRENGTFLITNNTADTWKGGITIDANANVGIGTYTPTTKLDVEGSIKSSALSGTGDRVVLADATGVLKTGTLPANTNIYSNDGTLSANRTVNLNGKNLLFTGISDTAGKIGLGTTNPTAALTIVGTGQSSDDITIKSFSSTVANSATIFLERHRGTASAPAAVQVGDDLGGIVYKGYTSSGNLLDGVVLTSKVREVTANSLKADLFINSNSVGIGVATPLSKLQVNGGIRATQGFPSGNESDTGYTFGTDGDSGLFSTHQPNQSHLADNVSIFVNANMRLKVQHDGTVLASQFGNLSDARLKKDIATISNATATINNLNGVTYHWNNEEQSKGTSNKLQYGFIAQEVEKVLPDLVNTDERGYKSVNYIGVIPVLVEALQEKDAKIKELEARLERLEKLIK